MTDNPDMRARLAVAVLAGCTALPASVLAAEVVASPTHACARLQDRTQRLDCYDAAFARPADEASPQPATAATPAAPAAAAANFGLTPQQIDRKAPDGGSAKLDQLASKVVALKRGHHGQFTATLENGQIWEQIEVEANATIAIGDSVTIRRAAMSSYLMVTPRGVATRVRRIN
jgi:hypothetical protein